MRNLETLSGGEAERRLVYGLTVIFFLGLAEILITPLFSHSSWLVFVQDDFLYYLKVAQNFAHGRGSTFNGVVQTNGYQPLWFIILSFVSRITQNGRAILGFLAISNFVAAMTTFLLSQALLQSTRVRPLLAFVFAGWTTIYALSLFFYGMETTLTVPLMLGVVCLLRHMDWLQRGPLQTFLFGLLLSAMVLSRIDTLIFGALLLAGLLLSPSLRRTMSPRLLLGLTAGLLPVAAYFGLNRKVFGTWMPVSGMAKELKFDHVPSLEPWRVFFHPLAGTYAVLLLFAIALLVRSRHGVPNIDRVLFSACLLFPFLYYFVLSCVSDWTLWGWYMYPLRVAVCVSFVILCSSLPIAQGLQKRAITVSLALTVFVALALLHWRKQQADIYAASVEIVDFARAHPGTYAMGDRAGRVAYLLDQPVIQIEGLMMDRAYLNYIARQIPLREVLSDYGVRYYIATAYKPFSGCFEASEPAKAGPDSPHMRAEFCDPPLATFFHDGNETLIFDVKSR